MHQQLNLNMTRHAGSAAMDSIDRAVFYMDEALQKDNDYMDLSDLLVVPKHTSTKKWKGRKFSVSGHKFSDEPSLSGLQEHDYPSLASIQSEELHEIGNIKKTNLPPEIVERFSTLQCNCQMGIFPKIKRAWLSIDSDIFLWNYEDGSDVAYFDGLSETILCAALVKPKPGIFQPHIVYLLCLATAVDVVLLGVSFAQTGYDDIIHTRYEEMHLLPEPLFSVPTDNVHMINIQSTESGRIFMAGKDGCLHELFYQAEDGWFSRRCRKINHSQSRLSFLVPSFLTFADDDPMVLITIDESRHLLYTLSEKGGIQLFDISGDPNCQAARFIASISHQTIVHNASLIARNVEKSNFHPIIHISAVSKFESANINLVAVTHTGARIYFTTRDFAGGSKQSGSKPWMLSLVHVRLPPGYTIQSTQGRPMNVHSALYSNGVLLLAASQSEDNDNLWMLSGNSFPYSKQLSESHEVISVFGRTWSMAEESLGIPTSAPLQLSKFQEGDERPDPPSVVTQHLQIERQFVLVNSSGASIIQKLSPVDQLQQLLLQFGPESDQVKGYFRLHKDQACATCLVLMCSRSAAHLQVNDAATRAFFLFSGEPDYGFGRHSSNAPVQHNMSVAGPPTASTPIPNVARHLSFRSPGASAIIQPPATSSSPSAGFHQPFGSASGGSQFGSGPQVIFSNKHNSLYLYLARLLRPLWQNRMVTEVIQTLKTKKTVTHLTSIFDSEQLTWILHKLNELKDFLDINSAILSTSSPATAFMSDSFALSQMLPPSSQRTSYQPHAAVSPEEQAANRLRASAEAEETISLKQLHQLISLSCEYLGLWKILCDHQFNIIARTLTQDQQLALKNVTFEQLVTSGHDICQALAKRLVDMYIDDNAATDIINARLREVCPSLYSCHDEIYSKGYEKLKSAKMIGSVAEKDKYVLEALEQFKMIVTRVDLPSVCAQFASLKCYTGIVDLVLTTAAKRDPQNLALHYYMNQKPQADIQGAQAYNIRMDCYKVIMETMDYLLSTTHFNPQAPSVPKSPGPPPANDAGRLSSAEAEHYIEKMYEMIVRSDDQMAHVALYDWLIYKDMSEKLLEIQSPYLEQYLKHGSVGMQRETMGMLDLLWKYYEKNRNFSSAARILSKLAEKESNQVPLHQRLEYLSRAIMCAKSCTSHTSMPGEGEFLHELEEKMEVARLQLHINEVLNRNRQRYPREVIGHALDRLNSVLLEISVLYSDYAETFELPECKLAIIHCAGHFDPTLVETLWREIIDKELESTLGLEARVRVQSLHSKLVAQGKKYVGTENYFPLVSLVKYLEKLSCNVRLSLDQADVTFVFRAMLDIGVSLPRLFDVYDKIFKSKDTDWKNNNKPYHLLSVIYHLLSHFAARPQIVPTHERRQFVTRALDAIASYLVELQAETTVPVSQLMANLQDLKARLQRVN